MKALSLPNVSSFRIFYLKCGARLGIVVLWNNFYIRNRIFGTEKKNRGRFVVELLELDFCLRDLGVHVFFDLLGVSNSSGVSGTLFPQRNSLWFIQPKRTFLSCHFNI